MRADGRSATEGQPPEGVHGVARPATVALMLGISDSRVRSARSPREAAMHPLGEATLVSA